MALREILASVAVKLFIGAVWSWWIKRRWSEVVNGQLMISNRWCRQEIVLINKSQKCFSLLTSIASVKEGGGQVLCKHMFSHYCRWCIEAEKAIRVWHSHTLRLSIHIYNCICIWFLGSCARLLSHLKFSSRLRYITKSIISFVECRVNYFL